LAAEVDPAVALQELPLAVEVDPAVALQELPLAVEVDPSVARRDAPRRRPSVPASKTRVFQRAPYSS
jgi:hypothetical protein